MNEQDKTNLSEDMAEPSEFTPEDAFSVSSGELIRVEDDEAENFQERLTLPAADESEDGLSPVFKELREPKLPTLAKENRARLQMQTPNRLYFYWSMKSNPFQVLSRAFGGNIGSYTLVAKLLNLSRDTEEVHAVDAEGNWWFNVDPDSSYRAEVGFYAPNRPYFRALYSNTITTPRKSPSPRVATSADWRVPAEKFAEILDVSGFKQDAFDVVFAGDDWEASAGDTREAFVQFIGTDDTDFDGIPADEIRYALMMLAAGVPIDSLRWKISASLFAILQANAENLIGDRALAALRERFGIEPGEELEEEQLSAVFGASLINFPRKLKRRRHLPKFESISSHTFGSSSVVRS